MSSTANPQVAAERSLLERLLRPIADVRPGEGPVVLLLSLNLFLVLLGYYVLKTIRESLVLTESGAAVKTYASAGQALLLLVLVPAFAAFASRVNRVRLLTGVTAFFIANLGLFYLAGTAWGHLGIPFFLWVGIFNTMGIAQFWAFANDLYTPEQGKRLFAIVMLAANLGAFIGGMVAKQAFKTTGPYNLMLVAAAILAACIAVARRVHTIQVRGATPEKAAEAAESLGKVGAFELLRQDRYLMLMAALVVLINIVNTTGEYLLGRMVVEASEAQFGTAPASLAARQAFVGSFYGGFFSLFNFLGFSLQIFVVSRVIRLLGVGGALFVHPLVALVGYVGMAGMPNLAFVRNLKVLDNSLDYSLNNTAKQALWLPTSREAKYKAKQAVDSFFYRAGDVLAAAVVWVGQTLAFTVPVFAAINTVISLVWLAVAWALRRENKRRVEA